MFFRRRSYRGLPTLPRRPSVATPSTRRGISENCCRHYPARYRSHHFVSAGNLDRSVVFIYGNSIIPAYRLFGGPTSL